MRLNLVFTIAVILLLSNAPGFAKDFNYIPYYQATSHARYKLFIGELDSSIFYFKKAFKGAPYIYAEDYYMVAKCYAKKGDSVAAYENLKKAFSLGALGGSIGSIDDSELKILITDTLKRNELKLLAKDFKNWSKNDEKDLIDSAYYYHATEGYLFPSNKDATIEHWRKYIDTTVRSHDDIAEMFVHWILRNGWVSTRKCGLDNLILECALHLSVEQHEKILPLLYTELKNGYLTPGVYAMIHEKYLLNKYYEKHGRTDSCYYYQIKYDCGPEQWPVIIKNRQDIGLSLFLDSDDYILFKRNKRHLLPWAKNK